MHRASCGFMPLCGITETLSDTESVRVVHGNVLEHNPLSDEVHTRVLKFMPDSEDYEAFIASTYKSKVTMQRIFAVLSLAAVVAGIFIWKKLSAKGY